VRRLLHSLFQEPGSKIFDLQEVRLASKLPRRWSKQECQKVKDGFEGGLG
jgi:hypothetical protein